LFKLFRKFMSGSINKKKKILLEIELTQKCSRRCFWCDRIWEQEQQSEYLDSLIQIIFKSPQNYTYEIIFFWWNSVEKISIIKYFISQTSYRENISYSIVTDGFIFPEEAFKYFLEKNVKMSIFIDPERYKAVLWHAFLQDSSVTIFCMVSARTIKKSFSMFKDLCHFWFKDIVIFPDLDSSWDSTELGILRLIKVFLHNKVTSFSIFSLKEKIGFDYKFILSSSGEVYSDITSHLWFTNELMFLNSPKIQELKKEVQIWKITNFFDIDSMLVLYDKEKMYKISYNILADTWILRVFTEVEHNIQAW